MIVDTSAVVAILTREPGWETLATALRAANGASMSAGTYVELGIVVDRLDDPSISRRLDRLLAAWNVAVVPLTPEQAAIARAAYADYGRGSGHPARLNLGDCFAYALASETGRPLLFKGSDFEHTDLAPAVR
ncbi:MAG: type II toxin-antitoxin system VapC family toxin [Micrococcales bacterium]|nr:type II toxin-antitoxin system VapC family toxin [Micrococcales bacterium]